MSTYMKREIHERLLKKEKERDSIPTQYVKTRTDVI